MISYIICDEENRVTQFGTAESENSIPKGLGEYFIVPELPTKSPSNYVYDQGLIEVTNDVFEKVRIRSKRDAILQQSDWTQLPDVPDTIKQSYTEYRQALRDITDQDGFPYNVTWPTKPEV